MRAKTYLILERAVCEGALLGYRRAFKHNENPSEDAILDEITEAVMLSVCEVFDFPEQGDNYQ
jgi:hypothetical protein